MRLSSFLMAGALLALGPVVHAQVEQATITGTVRDESGAVVPGARVAAVQLETRTARETVTSGAGRYTLPYLSVGTYEVSAELAGFSRARVAGVTVRVGLVATVDLELKPGALATEVTVTASGVQLELQSAALGTVIGSRQMLELPIVGRNPYSLVTLAPGVVDRGNAGTGPIINGARSNSTAVLLDGAEQRNSTTNDLNYTPPLESVQEFKVVTNGLSAEFGRTGGGVITSATRAGTNEFRGSAYGYLRRDKFNANSWTNKRNGVARGREDIKQYGFTFGGPVSKNRTFFFVNLEYSKSLTPDNVIVTVPTLKQRAGDFSETRTGTGQLVTIFDPLTTRPNPAVPGTFIRDPFPGNVIPPDRIDAIAKKILEFYPLPTNDRSTQNFVQERSRTSKALPIVARVDHNWRRQHLFAAFRRTDNEDSSPTVNVAFPDPGTNGERGTRANDRLSTVLSDTVVFRSNLMGEFRLGYTRNHFTTTPATLGLDFSSLGIGAGDPALQRHSAIAMFPRIDPTGGVEPLGMNRAGLIDDLESTKELQAHVTWVKGSHTVRGGLQAARMGFDVFRPEYPSGQYIFGPGFTQGPNPQQASGTAGFGLATFLLGAPTGGQISGDPRFNTSQKYWAPYIQDDWKVTSDLTLNLGLRYEYQTPWVEKNDQLTFFDPDATDPLTGRKGLLRLVARDGSSRYQTDPDRNNIAPRIGFAWRFEEKMVLRGGYGIVYYPGSGGIGSAPSDLGGGGFLTATGVNLGQLPTALLGAPNTPPPGSSLRSPFTAGYFEPPATQVGGSVTTAFRDLQTPYAHMWNVSLQRELPWRMIGEAAYVGSRNLHVWTNLPRNSVPAEFLSQGTALNAPVPNPFFGIIRSGDAVLTGATTNAAQLLKPFPQYNGITRFRDSVGESWYNGLTLRLEKRAERGLTFQLTYTLSREEDTVPERFGARASNGIVDPRDLGRSKAVADDDRTHVLTTNFIWELPVGPGRRWASAGWASHLVGGWRLSGVGIFATGRPLVLLMPVSNGPTGIGAYASVVGELRLPAGQQTYDRWFNSEKDPTKGPAVLPADAFTIGNGKRTFPEVRGPKVKRLDLMLSRLQKVGTRALELRVEAQNALNTPQLADPVGDYNNVNFGRIITGGGERRLQLGLRLAF
jgi:hypothetical protein